MLALLSEGLGLAKAVATYLDHKQQTKWLDKVVDYELRVKHCLDLWPNLDDALLASLLAEKRIFTNALASQIQLGSVSTP